MKIIKSMLFFGLLSHSFAYAAEFNVNNAADTDDVNSGDGICDTSLGVCTLRAAITEANASAGADTINLPAGTYNTSSSLTITSPVSIVGENTDTTIIDANDSARVFFISTSQPVSMSGFTIQGGNAGTSGLGGGIYINSNGDVTLQAMNVNNNKANSGCGIGSGSPINQLTISNSVIENNSGITGGSGPSTSLGGGLRLSQGAVTITDSTIRGNTADFGGGINFISAVLTLHNTTVSGNTSTVGFNVNGGLGGGGLHVGSGSSATLIAINSTISGNQAISSGAGMYIARGTASLYNTTITNNLADSDNDGVGFGGGVIVGSSGGLEISNSIIAGNLSNTNSSPDCNGYSITSLGYNIVNNNSTCIFTAGTGDQIGDNVTPINPLLGQLADNGGPTQTHQLLNGSPAIDGGNPSDCTDNVGAAINTDQRGGTRPLDGGSGTAICDAGAYETNPYPTANAGNNQVVALSDSVNLVGAGSSALAGIASYSWTQVPSETVTLVNAATDAASFVAPAESAVLTFELTVTDNDGLTDSDTVTITVNVDPVADAGSDQTVNDEQLTILDGSVSNDSDGSIQSYSWMQTAGTSVTINSADSDAPSFIAPASPGILSFQLMVTDDHGFTDSDVVNVTINTPPIANAGPGQAIDVGAGINLNGSDSTDADGSIQSYLWTQESGETVTLNNANSATPDFVAPATEGTLSFQLTVTDNNGAVSSDSVIVTVNQVAGNTGPANTQNNNGGGSAGPAFLLLLICMSILRRKNWSI